MKHKKIRSIKTKSLQYFTGLSVSFIFLVWLFQAIFFTTIYEEIKTNEIKNLLRSSIKNFQTSQDFDGYLQNISLQENVSIVIFKEKNEQIEILHNTTRPSHTKDTLKIVNLVILNMKESNNASFISDENENYTLLTYGEKVQVNDSDIYFCITSPITPVNNLTDSFKFLLLFISIGVLCLTIIGAYLLSNELSKPIQTMAKKAKEITSNKTNGVVFDSDQFSEIKQLSETLNYAVGELQKTDNIRKELLANVSHELKTPLTMIKSYTELIKDISGDNKERREEHLDVIYKEAERLEFLLNDMMDFSKLESGIISFDKTEFNLSTLLKRFVSIYEEKYTSFQFSLTCPQKVIVKGDQKRIEQVITNLLNNAINYSKNEFEIAIKLKKVPNQDAYKLEIIDKGTGISEENLPHIFERHFRSNMAKRTTVGSGIGLSIVKNILDGHGFQYGVISKENKGSNFFIIFPVHQKGKNL